MTRPVCTHPCHLNTSPVELSAFTWTCPRCKVVVPIACLPFVDPTPALVTR